MNSQTEIDQRTPDQLKKSERLRSEFFATDLIDLKSIGSTRRYVAGRLDRSVVVDLNGRSGTQTAKDIPLCSHRERENTPDRAASVTPVAAFFAASGAHHCKFAKRNTQCRGLTPETAHATAALPARVASPHPSAGTLNRLWKN